MGNVEDLARSIPNQGYRLSLVVHVSCRVLVAVNPDQIRSHWNGSNRHRATAQESALESAKNRELDMSRAAVSVASGGQPGIVLAECRQNQARPVCLPSPSLRRATIDCCKNHR